MLTLYQSKEYDAIFCYFLDTYASIRKNGRAHILPYIYANDEKPAVLSFLNEGIQLLECALSEAMFKILLESLFFKYYKACALLETEKLVIIHNLIQYLYKNDFISILDTANMWSDTVFQHGLSVVYPLLSEADKKIYSDQV